MSLILDALRKMELERRARRLDSPEMRREVLNYRSNAPITERPALLPVVVALLLVLSAAGGGWLLLHRGTPGPAESVKAPAPAVTQLPTPPLQQATVPPIAAPSPPATPPAIQPQPAPNRAAASRNENQPTAGNENIIISGIAWQDERALRRAVINGSLVGEGADVLGATVVEIREKSIRFKRGGEFFEIGYPSGGR